ncbi:O-acyltransferase WSD1-like [Asparagus officinalis]|uniref:O-acyltransferase WSD1-like n=1 Tax=Asparagus officinalis TaxID=4686 RepID=UPI00098E5E67|nr:O-acyltransferase WSD1-like [Asparagus officinalis]
MMGTAKTIDVDAVKAGLEASIARHPRFSSVVVSDDPGSKSSKWVPTKVIIDDHIIIPNINPPQTTTATSADRLVEDYASSLTTTSLPHSQPLWDFHIINMRTSEAEAVAILRIHHSLGDGVSLMSLLLACTRKTSHPDSLPSLPGAKRQRETNSDDTETPIKGVEGVELHKKRIVHRTLSLDDIMLIKYAVGGTINDVLVGVTSAGLSQYLNRRYSSTANGEKKENSLPAKIRLRTTVLVNIRPTPGIHALTEMMEGGKSTRWGNWLGYIILNFPILMYEDPLDYVRKGMKNTERKKNSLEAIFTYTSGTLIVKLLGIKAAAALCYRVLRHTTISFSNIVGPIEQVSFYGHPLVYIAPTVYGHPQAVTLHFQSYMKKIKVVLAVDELSVPDPHQLLDDLDESLKLIKDAVVTRSM